MYSLRFCLGTNVVVKQMFREISLLQHVTKIQAGFILCNLSLQQNKKYNSSSDVLPSCTHMHTQHSVFHPLL